MKKLTRGFSIMELIIVLVIMRGVATVGTVSMAGVQNRSLINSDKLKGAEIGQAVVMRETKIREPWTWEGTATGHNEDGYVLVDDTYHKKVCTNPGCDYSNGNLSVHRFWDGYDYCYDGCGKTNDHPVCGGYIKGIVKNRVLSVEWNFPQYDNFKILLLNSSIYDELDVDSSSCSGTHTASTGVLDSVHYMSQVYYWIDGVYYTWFPRVNLNSTEVIIEF